MNALQKIMREREVFEGYPLGFFDWLETEEGQSIWVDFEKRALQMAKVRDHYSARSIIQVMRWHTALKDGTEFKINNNWSSGLARYWLQKHGHKHKRFFRIRDSLGRDV